MVRDRRANWKQSLGVLTAAKDAGVSITKTSIMLGCGEHKDEVRGSKSWDRVLSTKQVVAGAVTHVLLSGGVFSCLM